MLIWASPEVLRDLVALGVALWIVLWEMYILHPKFQPWYHVALSVPYKSVDLHHGAIIELFAGG